MLDKIKASERRGELEFFIRERDPECVVGVMPVKEGALNPFGLVQTGAMVWLADVVATILAIENTELGPGGSGFPLCIDLHMSLMGNQKGGEIRAEARPVRIGKRVTVIRTRVLGENDRLLAEVTTTHVPAD